MLNTSLSATSGKGNSNQGRKNAQLKKPGQEGSPGFLREGRRIWDAGAAKIMM